MATAWVKIILFKTNSPIILPLCGTTICFHLFIYPSPRPTSPDFCVASFTHYLQGCRQTPTPVTQAQQLNWERPMPFTGKPPENFKVNSPLTD